MGKLYLSILLRKMEKAESPLITTTAQTNVDSWTISAATGGPTYQTPYARGATATCRMQRENGTMGDAPKDTTQRTLHEDILSFLTEDEMSSVPSIRTAVGSSKEYQDIAPLLLLPPQRLTTAISLLHKTRWQALSTVTSKLGTLVTLATHLQQLAQPGIGLTIRHLLRQYKATQTPKWDVNDKQKFCDAFDAATLHQSSTLLTAPAELAWLCSQRLGDVLLWRTDNICRVKTKHNSTIAVLVVEGKTVAATGPYTLHMPLGGIAESLLTQAVQRARIASSVYVFLRHSTILPKAAAKPLITQMERAIRAEISATLHTPMDLRALRRGGSTTMSLMTNAPQSQIATCTRHKNIAQLNVYHGAGLLDTATANTQTALIRANEEAIAAPHLAQLEVRPL